VQKIAALHDQEKLKQKFGYWEGVLSIIINTVLFVIKYWVGTMTSSVAVMADAWHTLSDSMTSIVVVIGFKMSSKPPDNEHPFGHGRAEIIGSVIIGTVLAIVGFNFLTESVHRFIHHHQATFTPLVVIVFLVSTLLKEGIAQFSFWGGRKYNSHALIADGWHHRSDAIASALIVLGFFLGKYYWWIDSVMGFMVSILIFMATYSIMKSSVSLLLGENLDDSFKTQLDALAYKAIQQDVKLHHIHLHKYGHHRELTCHIRFSPAMTLGEAHELADQFEETIRQELGIEATIHIEPELREQG